MEALTKSTVHIKNRVEVEDMISQLIKGGAAKLQVIADFDHTLSRVHKNGTPCDSTYGIIDNSPLVSEEYKKQALGYFQKYHPIEVDPHLTREEKIPHMIEWYTQARDSFKDTGITKDTLVQMVANSSACFRDDCDIVFKSLNDHNVPLLIFSAGVGDVLKQVLIKDKLLLPNMKFIANHFSYDENGKVSGFKDALIHTFNKDESSIQNHEYFEHVRSRNNVILLGDSLGDLDMSAGVKDVNVMLKIGFLNYKGLQTSGLGLHQRQPSYLPDYNGIFSLQALNFTPAAIDKTEKFLQILHADNPLAPNISLAALLTTTTQEGRQHASTDQTTDRLNPEQTEVGDYFNEVDSGNVKLHFGSGNTKPDSEGSKPDSDFSDSRLDSEGFKTDSDLNDAKLDSESSKTDSGTNDSRLDSVSGTTKPVSNLDLDSSNTKLSSDSNLELDSSNVKLYSGSGYSKLNSNSTNIKLINVTIFTNADAKNASTTTNADYTNPEVDLESSGDPNRKEVNPEVSGDNHETKSHSEDANDLRSTTQSLLTTAFPHVQLDTKTISDDLLQTSETNKKTDTESEKLVTTQAEDLFSTSDRTSQVAQSNNSDVLLPDSEKVEKQPDIFDHLMATIQSHWSEFVGKMKLSVLDVWKTISQQMMVRLENFATAL